MQEPQKSLFVCPECPYIEARYAENVMHVCEGIENPEKVTGFLLKPATKFIPLNA
jgi:hypothetical protein